MIIGILVVLVVLVVLNAFALNNETEKAHLTVPDAELVETTSGPLQVLDTGSPDGTPADATGKPADAEEPMATAPLVLIHGSGGAINWWDEVIPLLRDDHRVIAIDLLGYGGSSKPATGYSIESQAGLVAQVLSHLGVKNTVVVGHSLGGSVATSLVQNSSDLVSGVVLLDSSADRSAGGLSGTAKAALAPMLGQALWRISPDFILKRALQQAFAPGDDVNEKYVQDLRNMTYTSYRESARAGEDFTDDGSLPDRLASTSVPLLVIFGSEDQIYPARESLSAFADVPGVETKLLSEVGHSPQVEAPDRTANEILNFADRIIRADADRAAAAARRRAARERKTAVARRKAKEAKARQQREARNRAENRKLKQNQSKRKKQKKSK